MKTLQQKVAGWSLLLTIPAAVAGLGGIFYAGVLFLMAMEELWRDGFGTAVFVAPLPLLLAFTGYWLVYEIFRIWRGHSSRRRQSRVWSACIVFNLVMLSLTVWYCVDAEGPSILVAAAVFATQCANLSCGIIGAVDVWKAASPRNGPDSAPAQSGRASAA